MKRYVPQMLRTAFCLLGGMVVLIGCEDPKNNDSLLTNPHSKMGVMKEILPAMRMPESAKPVVYLKDQSLPESSDQVSPQGPVRPIIRLHTIRPVYSTDLDAQHNTATSRYDDGYGNSWIHIPTGTWASYYSTGDPVSPPDSQRVHIATGDNATTDTYMWHIYAGIYQSQYFWPTHGDADPLYVPVTADEPGDGTGNNAGLFIPRGSIHISSGINASSYERIELGYDRSQIPADILNR